MPNENARPDSPANRVPAGQNPPASDAFQERGRRVGEDNIQPHNQPVNEGLQEQIQTAQARAGNVDAGSRGQAGNAQGNASAHPAANASGDVRADRDAHIFQAGTVNFVVMAQAQQIKSGKGRGWMGSRRRGGEGLSSSSDGMVRRLEHVMDTALPDAAYASDEKANAEQDSTKLPETTEQIRDWYRNRLNDLEKCFVQAVAVLSGAPENEVRRVTSELYKPVLAEARRQTARRPQSDDLPVFSESIVLDERFQAKTYTTIRKVEGARRVLW